MPVTTEQPELREQLFAAWGRGDSGGFLRLCARHADTIDRAFRSWATVPEEIRAHNRAVTDWANALAAIANALEALGNPGPWEVLNPPDSGFPRWSTLFAEARELGEDAEFAASSARLRALLADMDGVTGPYVDDLAAKVYGMLGTNALHLDSLREAYEHTEEALRRCRASGDHEGVVIYTENLDALDTLLQAGAGTLAGRELLDTRQRLAKAQGLSDTGRFTASNEFATRLYEEVQGSPAHAGSRYLGKICGLLGLNHFRLGDPAAAQRYTREALAHCEHRADRVGIRIYTENLKVIARDGAPSQG